MTDGLLITALGMGVVFVGLTLTSLLIVSFSVVPQLLKRRAPAAAPEAPPASAPGWRQPRRPRGSGRSRTCARQRVICASRVSRSSRLMMIEAPLAEIGARGMVTSAPRLPLRPALADRRGGTVAVLADRRHPRTRTIHGSGVSYD